MGVSCATSKQKWWNGNDVEQETFCFNESLTMKAMSPPLQLAVPVSEEKNGLNNLVERDQHTSPRLQKGVVRSET